MKKLDEAKTDKLQKMRQKMKNSLMKKNDFKNMEKNEKKKKYNKAVTAKDLREAKKKKMEMRKKSKIMEENRPKQVIKLNAYRHVDKILNFIDNSENLSKNEAILNHFMNIKYKKKMDEMNRRIINKNKIEPIVDSENKSF